MAKYKVYVGYVRKDYTPKIPKPDVLPAPNIVTTRDGIPLQFKGCEGAAIRVLHPTNPNAPSQNFGITMLYMPPHSHLPMASHEPEECYVILEGEGTMTFTEGTREVKKGDFIHLPAWCEHSIDNTGDQPLTVLVATSPTNP